MGFENAVDELLSRAGSQFDPRLVEVFVANINADLIKQS
jgi:response regulator RpfG family c-di-GMP phosphodiesterase